MDAYSVYVHIPFCRKRCNYCDFNTYSGIENLIPAYIKALCAEIRMVGKASSDRLSVHTIYFGGGTPSLVPLEEIESILTGLNQNFNVMSDAEINMEANPGTVSLSYLQGLKSLGVNRLSLGVQSVNPKELELLGRLHTYQEVVQAVQYSRQAGFGNLNLDLIFGLPGQDLEKWQNSVENALLFNPQHLSLYALTIEEGTPFYCWYQKGLIPKPDDDLAADQYEWASDRLNIAGFQQYEISNWGKIDSRGMVMACKHNLQYWRNRPYLGFGAGAHGYACGKRIANVSPPWKYIERINEGESRSFPFSPAVDQVLTIDREEEMRETMMVGLRLTQEGVTKTEFQNRFGCSMEGVFGSEIASLQKVGLLEWAGKDNDTLRLTRRGRLLGNQVFVQFV